MVKWIILSILLLPVAEVAIFVVMVLLIGAGWTIALSLATSIVGFAVLRGFGRGWLPRLRDSAPDPAMARLEAHTSRFLTVLGGTLLLLPGFVTDLAGALLLVGPIRRKVGAMFSKAVAGTQANERHTVDLKPEEWQQLPDRDGPDSRNPVRRR